MKIDRRRARVLAMQALFQLDQNASATLDDMRTFLEAETAAGPTLEYAWKLITTAAAQREPIDGLITQSAANWSLDRMAPVDRNLLRVACVELLHAPEVPSKVAINEALEIAKKYSDPKAVGFLNGVLDRIRRQMPTEPPTEKSAAETESPCSTDDS